MTSSPPGRAPLPPGSAAAAPVSAIGRSLVVAQAALVAVFMVLETVGIRRMQPAGVERVPQI